VPQATQPTSRPRQRRLKPADRRQQLIEMTITCLAKYGPQGTGVRQICRELNVSPSLVNYFFSGRNELFVGAYQLISERFLGELRAVAEAGYDSPSERMRALVAYYFEDQHFDDTVVGAYTALWALSRTELDLKAAMSRFHHTQREILSGPIDAYARSRGYTVDADLLGNCLTVFLTGLWFEMALNPGNITVDMALDMASAWLDGNFRKSA
jgi:TetR/AcrR family transcriptional regulator, transcriptional repressor of bet genes